MGADADLLILTRPSLEVRHVIARGSRFVSDGTLIAREKSLKGSNRRIEDCGGAV